MAEKKELTLEETLAQRKTNAKKTLGLEDFQKIVALGQIKQDPYLFGQVSYEGSQKAYDEALEGDAAKEIRQKLIESKRNMASSLGTYSQPSIDNFDVEVQVLQQVQESLRSASAGDLENLLGSTGLKLGLPDELKNYSLEELDIKIKAAAVEKGIAKADENFIKSVLNDKEITAYSALNGIVALYGSSVTKKYADSANGNYLGKLAKPVTDVIGAYKKAKEESASNE